MRKSFRKSRHCKRELRQVVDTIPALVWSALPDGSRDFISRRWLEYTGLSPKDGLGWGWTDVIHPEDQAAFVDEWKAALASGEPLEAEARLRRADGQYRWFLIRGVPLRDEQRRSRNGMERRQTSKSGRWPTMPCVEAKRVLREQAGLLDLTHDTVFVRDMNDVITYWNRGAEELYGWRREEAVGKVTHELLQTVFPAPPRGDHGGVAPHRPLGGGARPHQARWHAA